MNATRLQITSRLLVAVGTVFLPLVKAQQASPVFAFTHVAVIDVVSGHLTPDMTVVIAGGRINAIGKSASLRAPVAATLVEAKGKFLIPGLWDMHVHWYEETSSMKHGRDYLPLYLANGVTGIRIMAGGPDHYQWRKDTADGTLVAPRLVIASSVIGGPGDASKTIVHDESEARQAVIAAKSEGAEFIKIYNRLSRDAFFAIADESRKQGLPFVGHVPIAVPASEASDSGMKSIEHLTGIIAESYTRQDELNKLAIAARQPGASPEIAARAYQLAKDSFSREKAEALLKRFKQNHTWQTPTLIHGGALALSDVSILQNDPRLKYLPEGKSTWAWQVPSLAARRPEEVDFQRWEYAREVEIVGLMQRLGVGLLAGTDSANPLCFPGFGLHDELALLVKAGLTSAEALRTATINPARFLDREADLGTVATGRIADLVLLDANPLQDIRNTARIRSVVVNGLLLDRAALDKMLSQVEAVALANQKTVSQAAH